MTDIRITEVEVYPFKSGRLVGYAHIVINNAFIVNDLKIIQGRSGLFVAMPSRKQKDGSFIDIAHPLNEETRMIIHEAVISLYERRAQNGRNCPHKSSSTPETACSQECSGQAAG